MKKKLHLTAALALFLGLGLTANAQSTASSSQRKGKAQRVRLQTKAPATTTGKTATLKTSEKGAQAFVQQGQTQATALTGKRRRVRGTATSTH